MAVVGNRGVLVGSFVRSRRGTDISSLQRRGADKFSEIFGQPRLVYSKLDTRWYYTTFAVLIVMLHQAVITFAVVTLQQGLPWVH